jgi:hypothetical protein
MKLHPAWKPIGICPPLKTEVLLLWTWPEADDAKPIIRPGSLLFEPFDGKPIFKIEVDLGDASAMFFTDKNDAPTHWQFMPAVYEVAA